ncbi:MAG TPA: sulfatase [Thermoanaerobaculia bacterium]
MTADGWRRAVALLLAAGAAACEARPRRAIHLPAPAREWIEIAAETRPGTWLTSGDAVVWDLPAGPARRLDGGYATLLAGAPPGRLEVRMRPAEGAGTKKNAGSRGVAIDVPLSGDAARWSRWTADLPAASSPARLEITYRAATSAADAPRSLFLTEPALSTLPGARRAAPVTVVLFVVDTLRADRVSGYGYERPTTPRIDAYFREGARARVALPSADWTLPSHASLLTSTSVARHGVGRPGRILLPDDVGTLAEAFQNAGFRTLAVTGGGYVDPAFGFRRGFDRFAVEYGPAAKAVDTALSLLDDHADDPVFLFFHTYQLHDYAPDEASARALFPDLAALGPNWQGNIGALRARLGTDPSVIPYFRARYDAALRSVDAAFGRLLDGLARSGRLKGTRALLTSDHGETLCERTWDGACLSWGHGTPYVHEEELAVPLELRVPGRSGVRGELSGNAALLDVAPTLLDAAGIPIPAAFEGRSLVAAGPPAERILESEAPPLDAIAVRQGDHKLVRRTGVSQTFSRPPRFHFEGVWLTGRPFAVLPAEECFDLSRDPGETQPVPCGAALWSAPLREALDRYLASGFPGSLVLRIPAAADGTTRREAVVRARGRGKAPTVRTFGLAPAPSALVSGDAVAARFHAGPAPVWIALEPADRSGAIEIVVAGLDSPVSPAGRALTPGSYRWRELEWGAGRLPAGVALFTTPVVARSAGAPESLPNDVVARLRALGYLAGADAVTPAPAAATSRTEVRREPPSPPLAPGEVRIRLADAS